MVALSMADGYARLTRQPQAVIVHVDVGTQGLGAAIHNASTGRAPVLIFAGLSPFTQDGELRGSRTEYIHWIQDVPDQKQIVAQYCRFTAEFKTGRNIKQIVHRALQFATSDPAGPVYVYGAREIMEEEIEPYTIDASLWSAIGPAALPELSVETIAEALVNAMEPLVITGYSGRNHAAVAELVKLAETVKGLRVMDCGGSDLCFPGNHRSFVGVRYGVDPIITSADVVVVIDSDIPWIPKHNKPKKDTKVFHIDSDPLKNMMPVFYIEALGRWRVDSTTAIKQINATLASSKYRDLLSASYFGQRWDTLGAALTTREANLQSDARMPENGLLTVEYLTSEIRKICPEDTIWVVEAVTNVIQVCEHLRPTLPGSFINCGGGGLGWSGGAALGIKLATEAIAKASGATKGKFVCQIVGDGTFLFSVPGSVYWISAKYKIPVLTIILNNVGKSFQTFHAHTSESSIYE